MQTISQASEPSFAAALRLFQAHAQLEERFANALGAIHGLSLKDTLLLMHVARAEGGRLSRIDLAKRLSVSPSTVTRIAAPLEKLGFLGRESHERDARYAYVVLTKAGRRAVGEAQATFERVSAAVFADRWTRQEIVSLAGLLGRFTADQPGALA
jgi:DNA-binding MarR family transcriptional regulator